jgi:molybdopterin molybdotransferase
VLERAGVKILFTRVAVQPGKPTTFGLHPGAVIFGLAGNPVSSFIQFELLIKPLISSMMGHEWRPVSINLPMKEKFTRRIADRMAFIPVTIANGRFVSPVEYHGSAHISALHEADGIIAMPVGKKMLEKGEIVSVRQI